MRRPKTKDYGGMESDEMTDLNDFRKSVEKGTQEMQRNLDPFQGIIERGRGDNLQGLPGGFDLPAKVDPSLFWNSLTLLNVGFQYIRLGSLILNRIVPDDDEDPNMAFCGDCPSRDSGDCLEPCGPLENELPKTTTGAKEGVFVGLPTGAAMLDAVSGQYRHDDLIEKYAMWCTSEQKKVLIMHYRHNMTAKEIAEELGKGERTVNARLRLGEERLVQARREEFAWAIQLINRMREEK